MAMTNNFLLPVLCIVSLLLAGCTAAPKDGSTTSSVGPKITATPSVTTDAPTAWPPFSSVGTNLTWSTAAPLGNATLRFDFALGPNECQLRAVESHKTVAWGPKSVMFIRSQGNWLLDYGSSSPGTRIHATDQLDSMSVTPYQSAGYGQTDVKMDELSGNISLLVAGHLAPIPKSENPPIADLTFSFSLQCPGVAQLTYVGASRSFSLENPWTFRDGFGVADLAGSAGAQVTASFEAGGDEALVLVAKGNDPLRAAISSPTGAEEWIMQTGESWRTLEGGRGNYHLTLDYAGQSSRRVLVAFVSWNSVAAGPDGIPAALEESPRT